MQSTSSNTVGDHEDNNNNNNINNSTKSSSGNNDQFYGDSGSKTYQVAQGNEAVFSSPTSDGNSGRGKVYDESSNMTELVGMESQDVSVFTGDKNHAPTKRRAVACKSCHALKVKCTPIDVKLPLGPCVRCAKAKRKCEVDLAPVKRRKRKIQKIAGIGEVGNLSSPDDDTITTNYNNSNHRHSTITNDAKVDLLEARIRFLEGQLSNQQKSQQYQYQPHTHSTSPGMVLHPNLMTLHPPVSNPTPNLTQSNSYGFLPLQHTSMSINNNKDYQSFGKPAAMPAVSNLQHRSSFIINDNNHNNVPNANLQDTALHEPSVQATTSILQPSSNRERSSITSIVPSNRTSLFEKQMSSSLEIGQSHTNTDELQKLQEEINLLMNHPSIKLSALAANVLKIADKRIDLINNQFDKSENDIIGKGYITKEQAEERLRLYKGTMTKFFPFVTIPENETVESLSSEKPFLFCTLMSVTAVAVGKDQVLEKQFDIDLVTIKSITNEVLIIGNKSMELLKSLLLLCIWYNTPELFHHRRYHLINSLCVSMVNDLGLTGRPYFYYNREEGSVCQTVSSDDLKSLECRRILMTSYFTSISICLFLRRRMQVSWSNYLEECCDVLYNSNVEGDKIFVIYTELNHMLEKIYFIVQSVNDVNEALELNSERMRYIVNELQLNLNKIKSKIDKDDHLKLAYYYSVQAYLHEPALHKLLPSANNNKGIDIDLLYVDLPKNIATSIDKCTQSCLATLYHASQLSLEETTVMPLFFSSRIIYTAGMLLRLRYLVISIPSMSVFNFVPRESVEKIHLLSQKLEKTYQNYPSNHLLCKIRLVITVFNQTYTTQLKNLLEVKSKKRDESDERNYRSENHAESLAQKDHRYSLKPLDILSDAAAKAHADSQKEFKENILFKITPEELSKKSNEISDDTNNGESTSNYDNRIITNVNLDAVEFSYYALNDEFWGDLLMGDNNVANLYENNFADNSNNNNNNNDYEENTGENPNNGSIRSNGLNGNDDMAF